MSADDGGCEFLPTARRSQGKGRAGGAPGTARSSGDGESGKGQTTKGLKEVEDLAFQQRNRDQESTFVRLGGIEDEERLIVESSLAQGSKAKRRGAGTLWTDDQKVAIADAGESA